MNVGYIHTLFSIDIDTWPIRSPGEGLLAFLVNMMLVPASTLYKVIFTATYARLAQIIETTMLPEQRQHHHKNLSACRPLQPLLLLGTTANNAYCYFLLRLVLVPLVV